MRLGLAEEAAARRFAAVLEAQGARPGLAATADRPPARLALEALERARTDLDAAVANAGINRAVLARELAAAAGCDVEGR